MKHIGILVCLTVLSISHIQAEVLRIPISQQGASSLSMPAHGDKQAQVLQQFGEPRIRHQSVGQPPISRWDYPNFSVYFEYTTVINSVQIHQPRTPITP
ncbi:phosphodiesterase [Pseudomonas sp. C27(2019)]|uniref:phosphodiesterase n=1 Tax=Pseudomonas sp. C27(2019) TaxID=2604941 RepID=UPI00124620BC|nr:phosphodiesterase [Pseudomonas sp. C27(2019)]QEY58312.1 phosphodiesterase [Pseudomonas sp. C27(2019)]